MPGLDGTVDSLAAGKHQGTVVRTLKPSLLAIVGLDESTLRALVAVGLSGIDQARGYEQE